MRAAVLGHPIAHSLSPALHAAAHAALGLAAEWRYDALDVTAEQLPALLAGLGPEWGGLSLTMPLKQAVLPLLAGVTPLAAAVGSVNTVLPAAGPLWSSSGAPGEPLPWHGANTDVHGIVAALAEGGVASARTASVLGGGATAASAVAALHRLGVGVLTVHVRSPLRAAALQDLADGMGVEVDVAPWERATRATADDVVVSTVPAGAADGLAAELLRPGASTARPGVLLDAVYAPWPTALASAWGRRGGAVVGGSLMLLHQAAEQVRLMTGREAPVEAMRAALDRMTGGGAGRPE